MIKLFKSRKEREEQKLKEKQEKEDIDYILSKNDESYKYIRNYYYMSFSIIDYDIRKLIQSEIDDIFREIRNNKWLSMMTLEDCKEQSRNLKWARLKTDELVNQYKEHFDKVNNFRIDSMISKLKLNKIKLKDGDFLEIVGKKDVIILFIYNEKWRKVEDFEFEDFNTEKHKQIAVDFDIEKLTDDEIDRIFELIKNK